MGGARCYHARAARRPRWTAGGALPTLPGVARAPRLAAILAIGAHLFAASVPCPPQPGADAERALDGTRGHASHAMSGSPAAPGSSEPADGSGAVFEAPCFCGCGSAPAASPAAARLGFALLAAAPQAPLAALTLPLPGAVARAPAGPVLSVDPVPV